MPQDEVWQALLEGAWPVSAGAAIMRISQVVIVCFGCFMGVMAIILLEINISLGCAACMPPASMSCSPPCMHDVLWLVLRKCPPGIMTSDVDYFYS